MKRKIIFAVLLIIVVVGAVAAWKYFEKTDDLLAEEPAEKLTASELIAAFNKDTAAANRRFVNKVVEVTGAITQIDSSAITLGEEGSPSAVVAGIDQRHAKTVTGLRGGTTATVQGRYTGYSKESSDDLFAGLGVTINLGFAGVKNKK